VTEWHHGPVRALLADRADLLVWLELPRARVMGQVVRRTLRRRLRHEVLWHGDVEPPLRTVLADPEQVVRWAWSTHARTRERVPALPGQQPGLVLVRLGSHREADGWLRGPLARAVRGRR